ncbi:MAG: 50S ribosomal protein L20 [Candidatus Omnitrophota bacterium]
MPRATRIPATQKRKKKVFKRAKGFFHGRRTLYRTAKETVQRALAFATRDRKQRKRQFRVLWTARINAACKANGLVYSRFIHALKAAKVALNRKSLSELAVRDPEAFAKVVQAVAKS